MMDDLEKAQPRSHIHSYVSASAFIHRERKHFFLCNECGGNNNRYQLYILPVIHELYKQLLEGQNSLFLLHDEWK